MSKQQGNLLDLIDLKQVKQCKVNLRGYKDVIITSFIKHQDGSHSVMLAGGQIVPITKEEYDRLDPILDEHLKMHM